MHVRAIIPYFSYGINRRVIHLFLNSAPGLAPKNWVVGFNRVEPLRSLVYRLSNGDGSDITEIWNGPTDGPITCSLTRES